MKLKKRDEVIITAGKDKGRKGKIDKVFPKKRVVLLPGLNVYKKHLKKRDEKTPGGIVDISRPLPIASVSLICPKCSKSTRVGFDLKANTKTRICKKCKAVI